MSLKASQNNSSTRNIESCCHFPNHWHNTLSNPPSPDDIGLLHGATFLSNLPLVLFVSFVGPQQLGRTPVNLTYNNNFLRRVVRGVPGLLPSPRLHPHHEQPPAARHQLCRGVGGAGGHQQDHCALRGVRGPVGLRLRQVLPPSGESALCLMLQ